MSLTALMLRCSYDSAIVVSLWLGERTIQGKQKSEVALLLRLNACGTVYRADLFSVSPPNTSSFPSLAALT